jgi:hypothetical protein
VGERGTFGTACPDRSPCWGNAKRTFLRQRRNLVERTKAAPPNVLQHHAAQGGHRPQEVRRRSTGANGRSGRFRSDDGGAATVLGIVAEVPGRLTLVSAGFAPLT